ncbi:hypothetical protein HUG15_00295 [Salicibibacter cibarius]|uniref:Uncharacterized protein n=1 Tax=Salicibibacter cibarius TaxID=2743000 RepID=A0A7T7C9U9_9BACI|nr:hypothetical protein [Salicibibacter cibarius]QQK74208.1 hypothetical protein HUG15_00295 [Salicibibacter cibarius]
MRSLTTIMFNDCPARTRFLERVRADTGATAYMQHVDSDIIQFIDDNWRVIAEVKEDKLPG